MSRLRYPPELFWWLPWVHHFNFNIKIRIPYDKQIPYSTNWKVERHLFPMPSPTHPKSHVSRALNLYLTIFRMEAKFKPDTVCNTYINFSTEIIFYAILSLFHWNYSALLLKFPSATIILQFLFLSFNSHSSLLVWVCVNQPPWSKSLQF